MTTPLHADAVLAGYHSTGACCWHLSTAGVDVSTHCCVCILGRPCDDVKLDACEWAAQQLWNEARCNAMLFPLGSFCGLPAVFLRGEGCEAFCREHHLFVVADERAERARGVA